MVFASSRQQVYQAMLRAAIIALLAAAGYYLTGGKGEALTLLIGWPLIFALYMAALRTNGLAFFMATVQIFVLSYCLQWLVWSQFKLICSPAPLALAMVAAALWGWLAKKTLTYQLTLEKSQLLTDLKERELREAHLQLVRQDEADRRILASDLHDQVLNDLKSLRVLIADHLSGQTSADPAEIFSLLDQSTAQVREVMENLTPSVLENLGLPNAIDDLLRRSAVKGHFKARFKNEAETALASIPKIEELLLFRTVQEALSNIVKHAQATKVEITISTEPSTIIIAIKDNGLGIPQDKARGASRGLRYMRQRADLIGAQISWTSNGGSNENSGCLVEIKMPIHTADMSR